MIIEYLMMKLIINYILESGRVFSLENVGGWRFYGTIEVKLCS